MRNAEDECDFHSTHYYTHTHTQIISYQYARVEIIT